MTDDSPPGYIGYLPPAFEQADDADGRQVLDKYLWIFQHLLGPALDLPHPGTETIMLRKAMATVIDALPDLFHPRLSFLFPGRVEFIPPLMVPDNRDAFTQKINELNDYFGIADPPGKELDAWQEIVTPAVTAWLTDLLSWQASWIGFAANPTWTLDMQRQNLATILPLFRRRGTADGLQDLLNMLAKLAPDDVPQIKVYDLTDAVPMTVGDTTDLRATYPPAAPPDRPGGAVVGGVRPFSFLVDLTSIPAAQQAALRRVIDQEKPAHTTYTIKGG